MTIIDKIVELKYKKLVPEIFRARPNPPQHSKVIVIGSGFGGAIASHRLAEKKIQTTVLERGSLWPNSSHRKIFSNDALPDARAFWHRTSGPIGMTGFTMPVAKFGGVFDVLNYNNLDVWCGACVGGGSIVFTGVMIEPKKENFDTVFNGILDYKEFTKKYYPLVRKMLALDTMPNDIYNSKPFGHSRVWDEGVRKAGYIPVKNDSIFNWSVVRNELARKTRSSAIIGESNLGNSNGAKFDLNQNYLKYAQKSGFCKIYSGHSVTDISKKGDIYQVTTNKIDPLGRIINSYTLTCDYLFVAAGTCGTSSLMVKARDKGTLPHLNEYVGEGFGSNGDIAVTRSFGKIKGIVQASPSASRIETISNGHPITFENWYAPGVAINLGIIGSLGMVLDMKNRGYFSYNRSTRQVELKWPKNGNQDAINAAEVLNNKICKATLTVPGVPLFVKPVNGSWTAHPLGGMVIGNATDNYGRVKGYKNLYVIDGALIPGSTGAVNPSLTISALAERNIQEIIKKDIK